MSAQIIFDLIKKTLRLQSNLTVSKEAITIFSDITVVIDLLYL